MGEAGGGRGVLMKENDRANKGTNGLQSHLELSLGIPMNNNTGVQGIATTNISGGGGGLSPRFVSTNCSSDHGLLLHQMSTGGGGGCGGTKRWLPETTGGGFVHPWSLAARQEKAALEQTHRNMPPNPPPSASRNTRGPPPAVVGWPPVRTFRKNLVGGSSQKTEMVTETETEEKDAKKPKQTEAAAEEAITKIESSSSSMYVKVNMEGYAVGRKIDLKAQNSYDSLSQMLRKMFGNFLCANISKCTKQEEQVEVLKTNYILLYEDNEGDKMLVGDVPWEMFVATVKRLYIAHDPRAQKNGDKGVA